MKAPGGSAFPVFDAGNPGAVLYEGMTLRDWFAGQALVYPSELAWYSEADDQKLLERFGTAREIEEGFDLVLLGAPMQLRNIELRAKLKARGRAYLRYLEADAMIAERTEDADDEDARIAELKAELSDIKAVMRATGENAAKMATALQAEREKGERLREALMKMKDDCEISSFFCER